MLPLILAAMLSAPRGEAPVLAYLFTLRRARHPLPHAWATYFAGCAPGSYKIHIHVDPMFNATKAGETGPAAAYFKQENVLPREYLQKVRRFGHELVQARMKLLRFATKPAADGTSAPMFYSFFSESCAPISPCKAVHSYLAAPEQEGRSFIDNASRAMPPQQVADNAEWQREFAVTCPKCAAAGIPSKDIRYSPGWVTLWRRHAKELVAKEHLYEDALTHWGWSKLVNMIPDESYWSMLAQHLGHRITGKLMTYMEAGDAKTGHSKMFYESDVPRLWQQPAPYFFARKFPTTPKIDKALDMRIAEAMKKPKAGSSSSTRRRLS